MECDYYLAISGVLLDRRPPTRDIEARVLVTADAVVTARQRGRELAGRVGFTGTDRP